MTEKPQKRIKKHPSWSDVKSMLVRFDNAGLTQLISDLYALNKENQGFLHARFSLGINPLDNYKQRIAKAIAPDIMRRNNNPSVITARKALSEYTKAVGDPQGILELRVFWCEKAVQFSMEYGYADIGYFDALLRQYRDACQAIAEIPEPLLSQYLERMGNVRDDAQMGYGVSDEMDDLLGDLIVNLPESTEEARIPIIGE